MVISIFGLYFNIFEILLLVLLTLYLPLALMNLKGKIKISNPKLFNVFLFAFGLYLCFLLLSIVGAEDESRVLKSFFKWTEIFGLTLLIFFYIDNRKNFRKIYWIFWISSFSFILITVLNILFKQSSLFSYRIFPAYSSAIALALIMSFTKKKNKTAIILSVICFLSAVLSQSRATWLILLIFAFFIYRHMSFKKKMWAISFAAILVSLLIWRTPLVDIVELRIYSKASNTARWGMINMALKAFAENPFTGIGSLNFPAYLLSNADRSIITADVPELIVPHNVFLQIAAEEGVFALFSFGVLLFIIYHIVFKVSKSINSKDLSSYLIGLKYITIVITINLFFGFISDQFRLVYSLYFGLSLSLLRLKSNEKMSTTKFNY